MTRRLHDAHLLRQVYVRNVARCGAYRGRMHVCSPAASGGRFAHVRGLALAGRLEFITLRSGRGINAISAGYGIRTVYYLVFEAVSTLSPHLKLLETETG